MNNKIHATYTSVWDGDYAVTTDCMVDLETCKVTDIGQVDVEGLEVCEREYVIIQRTEYEVIEDYDGDPSAQLPSTLKKMLKSKTSEDSVVVSMSKKNITLDQIIHCEQILMENGLDEDDALEVLQAIGYVLLDEELYPVDE